MSDIVTAVYNLMGQPPDGDKVDEDKIKDKVENLFNVSLFSINCTKIIENKLSRVFTIDCDFCDKICWPMKIILSAFVLVIELKCAFTMFACHNGGDGGKNG
jgi:hypothetical protein